MGIELRADERLDDLERNGYKIIQNTKKFCFGMDAVLLSGFAAVKQGERHLDLGCGTGIIPILLAAKTPGEHFTGLEIQEDMAEMAERSVKLNGLGEKIAIVAGDLKEASERFGSSSFHVVTCNPPYMIGDHGLVNPNPSKALARHEILCTLEDVLRESGKLLKPSGRFYMVHRPFRLVEILDKSVKYRLEPKRLRFVHPYVDKEPAMLLLECAKDGKPRMKIEKPLILYQERNVYTEEVRLMYGF